MRVTQAVTALTLVSHVAAFWRMPCRSPTGLGRIDPVMDPGEMSDHVHTIHGGGNFGFTTTYDGLVAEGSCTSCEVPQDHSAYWTPTMHFMFANGTTVMIEQIGGMLAYYLYYLDSVTAFPEGFRMLAGDKILRNFSGPFPDAELSSWPTEPTDQFFLQQRALGFNCLNYAVIPPEPSLYRHEFPPKDYMDANCKDGLRLELAFPSCWNGELDSKDHRSHVAYPSLVKEGNCPSGYDQHLPFLFYETIWATDAFAGEDGQFLLSNGDPTGAGYHGDYIMGWESQKFLQSALDTCKSESGQIADCPLFGYQNDTVGQQCVFEMPDALKDDDVKGPRDGLPVNVPVQIGPWNATAYPVPGMSGEATSPMAPPTAAPSSHALPTLSYSAANASETETAPGGIVVAMVSKPTDTSTARKSYSRVSEAPRPEITPSPPLSDAADGAGVVATSYTTEGDTVIEMIIEEVDVTVYATATPSAGSRHRRQLHKHLHREATRR